MRSILIIAVVVALVSVVGCGGGGGSTSSASVAVTVPTDVTSSLGTPTVQAKSAAGLPAQPSGNAFIAGAEVSPAGTVFTGGAVTLTFTFPAALANGVNVALFEADASNNWTQVNDHPLSVAWDRCSASVQLDSFNPYKYYAVLTIQ